MERSKMKKILIVMAVLLVVLAGCAKEEVINFSDGNEVREMMENKESFVLVFGNSNCSGCITYKPILEEVINNKSLVVTYIEIDTVDRDPVVSLVEDYFDNDIEYTPATFFIEEGEIVDKFYGAIRYTELLEKFEEHGYLQ